MEAQLIAPDERLLRQIFDQYRPVITVILQNRQKCVFKAELSEPGVKGASAQIVLLELMSSESEAFHAITILQQAAARILPDLVPKTQNVGMVEDCHGRALNFSVTQFVEGDTLQGVWSKLSPSSQDSIVAELVESLQRLHAVRPQEQPLQILKGLSSIKDKELIEKISRPGVFGGPHTGFIDSGSALLASFMERRKLKRQFCSIESNLETQSIHIRSNFEDLGSLIIHQSERDKWGKEAVLCHNDLTPRNLIIQQRDLPDGKIKHHLAGIIDWELAGFYPPSYELSLQDTYLGTANQHLSFYLKLKSCMESAVPWCSAQIKLLKANELI